VVGDQFFDGGVGGGEEVFAVDLDVGDLLVEDERFEGSADGFDFGEFGHLSPMREEQSP
jgi:hypothetical protein